MSEPDSRTEPPVTGDAAIDAVTAELADLDSRPLGEHQDRLASAHERLHAELSRDSDQE